MFTLSLFGRSTEDEPSLMALASVQVNIHAVSARNAPRRYAGAAADSAEAEFASDSERQSDGLAPEAAAEVGAGRKEPGPQSPSADSRGRPRRAAAAASIVSKLVTLDEFSRVTLTRDHLAALFAAAGACVLYSNFAFYSDICCTVEYQSV